MSHGRPADYNAGCRCPECWTAKQRYDKRRRWEYLSTGQRRKVPAYRALRRLQALQRLGWSIPVLATRLGLHHQSVYDIGRAPTLYRSRYDKIAALYEELCMTCPTGTNQGERSGITKARRHAERMGWPPPLAWDDIDDPDEQPTGIRTNDTRDLLAEWHDLRDAGESIEHAATRLGVTVGAIERAEFRARRKVA